MSRMLLLQPTPDGTCILDKHPRFKNIIFGVGFSGKGPIKFINDTTPFEYMRTTGKR